MQDFVAANTEGDTESYRIFCDCEGTLYGLANGEQINEILMEFLMEAQENGYQVQIFSNDPSGSKLVLRMAVFSFKADGKKDLAEFLALVEIDHKSMHENEEAAFIFDDDHSTHQSISDNLLAPDDPRIPDMTRRLKESNSPRVDLLPKRDKL